MTNIDYDNICGWDMGEGDFCLLPNGHDGPHS